MKIIFLDADGTLFHPSGFIPDSAKQAIFKAQQNGHKIVLCTGRQKSEIFGDLCSIDYDGIIAGAGARIEAKDVILNDVCFTKEQLQQLVDYLAPKKIPFYFEMNAGLLANQEGMDFLAMINDEYCKDLSEEEKEKHGVNKLYRTAIYTSYEDMIKSNANKISFMHSDFPYQQIYDDLHDQYNIIPCTFTPLGKEAGEIADQGVSKATGMDIMCNYFGISHDDIISIGDGANDIAMLQNSKVAIAMGNASDELKKVANYITTSILEDGIYNAFKHFDLI